MIKWVLIYWIVSSTNQGFSTSTASVEFNSEASCTRALAAMQSKTGDRNRIFGVCVAK